MDHSPRFTVESFHESKDVLLADFHPPLEKTACRECKSRRKFQYSAIIPWLISLILLVSFGVGNAGSKSCVQMGFWRVSEFGEFRVLIIYLYSVWSYEETVTHEIPATSKQVQFTATLKYNESHQVYRPVTQPPYVGVPTPEIDAAWEEPIRGMSNHSWSFYLYNASR